MRGTHDDETDGWIALKAATLNVVEWLRKAHEENEKQNGARDGDAHEGGEGSK